MIYNEKFDQIVSALEKANRRGDRVRAACPVHGSKGQTLSVTIKDGGYIVAHCFSCGAGGPELMKALGLPLSLLFPEGQKFERPMVTREMTARNIEDGFLLQFAAKAETLAEDRAVIKARERVKGYDLKMEAAEIEAPPISHKALDDFRPHFREALKKSSGLRSELVEAHWQGVAARAARSESDRIEGRDVKPNPKPEQSQSQSQAIEDWILSL